MALLLVIQTFNAWGPGTIWPLGDCSFVDSVILDPSLLISSTTVGVPSLIIFGVLSSSLL
jgi:hypothetical protein